MNLKTTQITAIATVLGLSMIDAAIMPLVQTQLIINPTATDQQVEDKITGDMKHLARQKIGFAVDFIFPFIEPYVKQEIGKEINNYHTASITSTPTVS